MDYQLTDRAMLQRAVNLLSHKEILTRSDGGVYHRYAYADVDERVCQLTHALDELELGQAAQDAAVAQNHYLHYELGTVVDEWVEDFTAGPQIALELAKQVINDGQDASLETALAYESTAFGVLGSTDDMVEGVRAFREDREPEFSGE